MHRADVIEVAAESCRLKEVKELNKKRSERRRTRSSPEYPTRKVLIVIGAFHRIAAGLDDWQRAEAAFLLLRLVAAGNRFWLVDSTLLHSPRAWPSSVRPPARRHRPEYTAVL